MVICVTKKQLKFNSKWQKLLRLQDWDITVKEVKKFKGQRFQTGSTQSSVSFLSAIIRVKKELDWKEYQRTVVHEMLHVRFPHVRPDEGTAAALTLEQGTEVLARLLVNNVRN